MPRVLTKKARSRKTLMHVAKQLYEEKGIENVTFAEIADAADMCRSTVFNHFPTNKDLMNAIYKQGVEDVFEYVDEKGLKGRALIETMFEKLITDTVKYPALTLQLITNSLVSGEGCEPIMMVEKRVQENLPTGADHNMTTLVLGAYYGLINHDLASGKNCSEDQLQKKFSAMLAYLLDK